MFRWFNFSPIVLIVLMLCLAWPAFAADVGINIPIGDGVTLSADIAVPDSVTMPAEIVAAVVGGEPDEGYSLAAIAGAIFTALFGLSEALAFIPGVKSNGVFQIVYGGLRGVKRLMTGKKDYG